MARIPRPWFRAGRGWFVQLDNRQVPLARGPKAATRKAAHEEFHRLMAARPAAAEAGPDPPVGLIVARYLDDLRARVGRGELAESSRQDAIRRLADFPDALGGMPCSRLRPRDVIAWLDGKGAAWNATTRHGAVGAIKGALNWAEQAGLISASPIRAMRKPERNLRREAVVAPELVPEVLALILSPAFRDLATFLWLTGCRPKEARTIEARWIDRENRRVVMPPRAHKTGHRTGKARVIHLPEPADTILFRWADANPEGAAFRNERGRPWTKDAVNCQVRRLRTRSNGRFGPEVCAYALRHVFATEGLERTGDLAGMAAAMGHSGTNLLAQVYSHLDKRHDHIRSLVDRIRTAVPVPTPIAMPQSPAEPSAPGAPASTTDEPQAPALPDADTP